MEPHCFGKTRWALAPASIALLAVAGCADTQPVVPPGDLVAPQEGSRPLPWGRPIPPEQAARRVGEVCTVEMKAARVRDREDRILITAPGKGKGGKGFAILLLSGATPDQFDRQEDVDAYLRDLRGRTVRAVGRVVVRDGRPGMEVDRPEHFRMLPE